MPCYLKKKEKENKENTEIMDQQLPDDSKDISNIWLNIWLYRMKISGFQYVMTVHNNRNLTRIYKEKSLPQINNNSCSVIIDFLIKLVL